MEQLQIEYIPVPGYCDHERAVVSTNDRGGNLKSLCSITGSEIWTNCREWGRCTFRGDVFGEEEKA